MAKSHENPLLPHRRMQEIFRAMVNLRAVAPRKRWAAGNFTLAVGTGLRDLEPVRVAVPDRKLHPAMRLALGQTPAQLRKEVPEPRLQGELRAHTLNQLYLALGAAAAARTPVLLVIAADDISPSRWERLLRDAATLQAPAVFAILPGRAPGLAELAQSVEVPGIPVDFADPVALYRVAGESLGRAKAGGGPALLEGLRLPGAPDAMTLFRRQMIARGAATEAWATREEQAPQRKGEPVEAASQPVKQVH